MIKIPGMIMIGAGDRNAGKTEFACRLIEKFGPSHSIIGIKVTTVDQANSGCPRGRTECGVCSSFSGHYCLIEETDSRSDKDTCKMRAAGAKKVFWLRVLKTHLNEGVKALLDVVSDDAILVCESNSLRQVVEPGLFVMIEDAGTNNRKPSAESVAGYVDRFISFDGAKFDIDLDEIELIDGRWASKMSATAIIMAGGKSRRMGQDKSMLAVNAEPLIKHIFEQIRGHFNQILISSDDVSKYNFLGVKVVPDKVTGKGPLMGIASALEASANEVNFVIACDIPEVDISFVRQMVRESKGFDAVVPRTSSQQYEPLFAVYRKTALAAIEESLGSGNNRIIDALSDCRVKYIDTSCIGLENLNTIKDYENFVEKRNDDTI